MNPDFQEKFLEEDVPFQRELNALDNIVNDSYKNDVELIRDPLRAGVVLSSLKDCSELVLDCEGVRLGREGKLTLIQLGTNNNAEAVYLFDVLALGESLFTHGMKEILESHEIAKYMFDCKKDSDALYHDYGVKLANVLDMQLYEFIVRSIADKPLSPPSKPEHYNADRVRGLGATVKAYVDESEIIENGLKGFKKLKRAGDKLMNVERKLWRYRPLSRGMERYAAMDIEMIRIISKAFQKYLPLTGTTLERLKIGSEIYVGLRRDPETNPDDVYVQHPIMVSYVIPEIDSDDNIKPFPQVDAQCCGCKRDFEASFIDTEESLCKDCLEATRVKNVTLTNN